MGTGDVAVELKLREFSDWLDWMQRDLVLGGIDLPSEETCVLFAASAVRLAERLRPLCRHLPARLRTLLIQGAILHQCWNRQVTLHIRRKPSSAMVQLLPALEALDFVRKYNNHEHVMECGDGHRYLVRFPEPDRDTGLATELICLEVARDMGLPVPHASLVLVSRELASRAGILHNCRASELSNNVFSCLGLRVDAEDLVLDESGRPELAMSPRSVRFMRGALVFDILTLNSISAGPIFRSFDGRAEPIFRDYRHCLMDSDGKRFLKTTYREPVRRVSISDSVKSYEQLEVWVRRAEHIDLQRIWGLAFKMPAEWYGYNPMLITSVLEKLDQRIQDLRRSILFLIKGSRFPGIPKASDMVSPLSISRIRPAS
jgi:hypothetical protein